MLGRQVTAALRRPLQARLRIAAVPQTRFSLCIRTFSHTPRLLDAAGRPKKAVGEPSTTVKRAVKKTAKKPALSKEEAAAEKAADKEKRRVAREKEKQKQKKEREAAAKQKALALKQAKLDALTPEQLEKKKAALAIAEVRALKKIALDPPFSPISLTAYMIYCREQTKGTKPAPSQDTREALGERSKQVGAKWQTLSPAEIEHLNHLAHTEREAAEAKFKSWVESHSVEEIRTANKARLALRRRSEAEGGKSLPYKWRRPIPDERRPKQPMTAWLFFVVSRHASGDFKNIKAADCLKLIGQEWKALSAEEKQKYKDLEEKQITRE